MQKQKPGTSSISATTMHENGHTVHSNGHSHRKFEQVKIAPTKVHETLNKHMLADGFDLVVDLKKSQGSWIEDARSGKRFLDFFTFFGSSPIGINHPKMFDLEFLETLQ